MMMALGCWPRWGFQLLADCDRGGCTVQCSILQYSRVQYSTLQYIAVITCPSSSARSCERQKAGPVEPRLEEGEEYHSK